MEHPSTFTWHTIMACAMQNMPKLQKDTKPAHIVVFVPDGAFAADIGSNKQGLQTAGTKEKANLALTGSSEGNDG